MCAAHVLASNTLQCVERGDPLRSAYGRNFGKEACVRCHVAKEGDGRPDGVLHEMYPAIFFVSGV